MGVVADLLPQQPVKNSKRIFNNSYKPRMYRRGNLYHLLVVKKLLFSSDINRVMLESWHPLCRHGQ